MFRHPFFKYSFFILLFVDLAFTLGLIAVGLSSFSIDSLIATSIWFVSFYWIPVWLAAFTILTMRDKGIENTFIEWLITVICLTLGLTSTDYLLGVAFDGFSAIGNFVFWGGLSWGTPIYFITRYIESRGRISREKLARKKAQLQTLRYQLNPHFMFNSLNTISAYIHSKPDLADEVLHELADILRYSLDTGEVNSVTLQQEVTIINKYLNIEKVRFGDRLIVSFDIPDELLNTQVPPLILQPIVENSIKHNAKQTTLKITIKVDKINHQNHINEKETLKISISDNGLGFSDEVLVKGFGTGVGMKNLQLRMEQIPQGKVTLSNGDLHKNKGATVTVEMTL
jgi:two-component system LytT family sensor kinase